MARYTLNVLVSCIQGILEKIMKRYKISKFIPDFVNGRLYVDSIGYTV